MEQFNFALIYGYPVILTWPYCPKIKTLIPQREFPNAVIKEFVLNSQGRKRVCKNRLLNLRSRIKQNITNPRRSCGISIFYTARKAINVIFKEYLPLYLLSLHPVNESSSASYEGHFILWARLAHGTRPDRPRHTRPVLSRTNQRNQSWKWYNEAGHVFEIVLFPTHFMTVSIVFQPAPWNYRIPLRRFWRKQCNTIDKWPSISISKRTVMFFFISRYHDHPLRTACLLSLIFFGW